MTPSSRRALVLLLSIVIILIGLITVGRLNRVRSQARTPIQGTIIGATTLAPTATGTPSRRATSTPTTVYSGAPLIEFATVETLFPVANYFTVRVKAAIEEIDSARLVVSSIEGGAQIAEITADLSKDYRRAADKVTEVYAAWTIDPQNAPPLFSTLRFEWTVRLKQNVTGKASNVYLFQDARTDESLSFWRVASDESATVASNENAASRSKLALYTASAGLGLTPLYKEARAVLSRITDDFNLNENYKFIIYGAQTGFCRRDGDTLYVESIYSGVRLPCVVEQGIALYREQGYRVILRVDNRFESVRDQIVSVILRTSLDRSWQANPPPIWFREGLYQLYTGARRGTPLTLTRERLAAGSLYPLEQEGTIPATLDDTRAWAAQHYLLVLYIADRFGADAPARLTRTLQNGQPFTDTLQSLYKVSLDTLFADFQEWLLTTNAERAVLWSPYSQTTSTPQPEILPSFTPTATSSEPTATLTLYPSPTVIPSATFTPSNTPLPPFSLETATPTPLPITAIPVAVRPPLPLATLLIVPLMAIGVAAIAILWRRAK